MGVACIAVAVILVSSMILVGIVLPRIVVVG